MSKSICFVIQQYSDVYDDLYNDVIEIAVKEAQAECIRAKDILGAAEPLHKIKSTIEEAAVCIAEVSEDNANVFFEVGYALALNRPTFILWDSGKRSAKGLPFDIHGLAGIPYDSTKFGWRKELREKLVANIIYQLTRNKNANETKPSKITVAELFEKYLPFCKKYNAPRTYIGYAGHIRNLLKDLGDEAKQPASTLKSTRVREWVDKQPGWGANYTRGAITAIQVAYNWAAENNYIIENPIKNMDKPNAAKRNNRMPEDIYQKILNRIDPNDSFRDVLICIWNTDCRPEEIRHLEAKHVDLTRRVIIMPQGGARARQKSRPIQIHPAAAEILEKLIAKHPTGELFLNTRGKPWTKYALCNRLHRYSQKIGTSYALSDCRNGVISDAIAA